MINGERATKVLTEALEVMGWDQDTAEGREQVLR
jgi:hypothetical protein